MHDTLAKSCCSSSLLAWSHTTQSSFLFCHCNFSVSIRLCGCCQSCVFATLVAIHAVIDDSCSMNFPFAIMEQDVFVFFIATHTYDEMGRQTVQARFCKLCDPLQCVTQHYQCSSSCFATHAVLVLGLYLVSIAMHSSKRSALQVTSTGLFVDVTLLAFTSPL